MYTPARELLIILLILFLMIILLDKAGILKPNNQFLKKILNIFIKL